MWIFLSIIGFLCLLITIILLLPVKIIIKSDEEGELYLRYKILFKTFGEDPDPNDPIIKTLKELSGITRIEKKNVKKNIKAIGYLSTAAEICRLLADFIKELGSLLKYCTAKKFHLRLVCSGEDAAEAAINYGKCCTFIYPLTAALGSNMKVRKKGYDVNVICDFTDRKEDFEYDFLLSVKLAHAVAAFFRVALKEARRTAEESAKAENQES